VVFAILLLGGEDEAPLLRCHCRGNRLRQLVPLLVGDVPVLDGRRAHRDRVATTILAGKAAGKVPADFDQYLFRTKRWI
jgi:hypothetical protein